jgi:hypothetical protein
MDDVEKAFSQPFSSYVLPTLWRLQLTQRAFWNEVLPFYQAAVDGAPVFAWTEVRPDGAAGAHSNRFDHARVQPFNEVGVAPDGTEFENVGLRAQMRLTGPERAPEKPGSGAFSGRPAVTEVTWTLRHYARPLSVEVEYDIVTAECRHFSPGQHFSMSSPEPVPVTETWWAQWNPDAGIDQILIGLNVPRFSPGRPEG